jgi:hypothetical protein
MQPDTKTALYLTSAVIGAVASVVLVLAQMFDWPEAVYIPAALATIVSLLVILRRKLRDEYTQSVAGRYIGGVRGVGDPLFFRAIRERLH